MTLLLLVSFLAMMAIFGLMAAGETPDENFEWIPDTRVAEYDSNQYLYKMLEDTLTDEMNLVYYNYTIENGSSWRLRNCNLVRFDVDSLSFEEILEFEYSPFIKDYEVYDGDLVMLIYAGTSENFSVAINDPSETNLIDFQRSSGYVLGTQYDIVAITDTEIIVLCTLIERGTSYMDQYLTFDLVTIDRETYGFSSKRLVGPTGDYGFFIDHNLQDNKLTIIWTNYGVDQFRAYWCSYDLVTGVFTDVDMFEELDLGYILYPTKPLFAPDGTVHLYFAGQGPILRSYDKDMNFVRSMDLTR